MKKHAAVKVTLCFLLLLIFSSDSSAKIIYVDDDAQGANNGSSWDNSYKYLQDALADAKNSEKPVEIRAAQGTYNPDNGINLTAGDYNLSFELINGVTISGGYAGITEPEPNDRNIELYLTILSGDLLNNDSGDIDPNNLVSEPAFLDNSFHVVTGNYTDESATLDGFIIKGGNASDYTVDLYGSFAGFNSKSRGGGIYIEYGKPVIANCTFMQNAAYEGGAIYNKASEPNIYKCKILENSANYYYLFSPLGGTGAALYNNKSCPVLKDCEFIENFSSTRACIYNSGKSNAVYNNCMFSGNTANLEIGGALLNNMSNPVLIDCNFTENYAALNGGGIANDSYSKPVLKNCVFNKNQAGDSGGAIYNCGHSEPNITECIFNGNSAQTGGAAANEDSNTVFSRCSFAYNQGSSGGGFYNNYGNPIFYNCSFINNKAHYNAGAFLNFFGQPVFRNCIFSGNFAKKSAGVLLNTAGDLKLINCTLTGNYAEAACSAVLNKTLVFSPPEKPGHPDIRRGSIDFLNCIIWNGENSISNPDDSKIIINYSDLQGGKYSINGDVNHLTWGLGNIDAEPFFAKDGLWTDVNNPDIIVEPNDPNALWHEGDYHLKSAAGHYDPNSKTWIIDDVNSPCIDAGDPNSSFANEPLPNGARINMGAYGNTPQASKSPENPQIRQQALKE